MKDAKTYKGLTSLIVFQGEMKRNPFLNFIWKHSLGFWSLVCPIGALYPHQAMEKCSLTPPDLREILCIFDLILD